MTKPTDKNRFMERQRGFSFIELTVAMAILTILSGVAMSALVQAQYTTNNIAQMANAQENLRAGMHFIVRDLTQAGEGIPPEGISVPNDATGTSKINRPGVGGTYAINQINPLTLLPMVIPGNAQGPSPVTVNPQTGAVLTGGTNTDTITVIYADNTPSSPATAAARN